MKSKWTRQQLKNMINHRKLPEKLYAKVAHLQLDRIAPTVENNLILKTRVSVAQKSLENLIDHVNARPRVFVTFHNNVAYFLSATKQQTVALKRHIDAPSEQTRKQIDFASDFSLWTSKCPLNPRWVRHVEIRFP